jgi:hypothetical protein
MHNPLRVAIGNDATIIVMLNGAMFNHGFVGVFLRLRTLKLQYPLSVVLADIYLVGTAPRQRHMMARQ